MSSSKKDIVFGETTEPTIYKLLDDFAEEVNKKLRQRGCGKGLVNVWSQINGDCLQTQKNVARAYDTVDLTEKEDLLGRAYLNVKDLCVDIRYLHVNKLLTAGEIGVLTEKVDEIKKQLLSWIKSTKKKASEG